MSEDIYDYFYINFYRIPKEVYIGQLVFFFVGIIALVLVARRNLLRNIAVILFIEYVFLLYLTTVVYRVPKAICDYNLTPFWSFDLINEGGDLVYLPILLNIIVFVPIGFLLGLTIKKPALMVMLMGVIISVSIEILQFLLNKGFAEVDDIILNTLGCYIGFLFYKVASKLCRCCLSYCKSL